MPLGDTEDPYKILGVAREASNEEIKKAYRQKARENHPDKHPPAEQEAASERFRRVQEAFDLLKNPKRKAYFDRTGRTNENAAQNPMGDFGSKFAEFFSRFERDGSATFSASSGPSMRVRSTVRYDVPCTLEELFCGATKKMRIKRTSTTLQRPNEVIIEIPITPGMAEGTRIAFEALGNEIAPGVAQDLEFVVRQTPHPVYKCVGAHLVIRRTVSLLDALCGFKLKMVDLAGVEFTEDILYIGNATKEGVVRVTGRGMPRPNGNSPGDLLVAIEIELPSAPLTEEQRDLIRRALGPSSREPRPTEEPSKL